MCNDLKWFNLVWRSAAPCMCIRDALWGSVNVYGQCYVCGWVVACYVCEWVVSWSECSNAGLMVKSSNYIPGAKENYLPPLRTSTNKSEKIQTNKQLSNIISYIVAKAGHCHTGKSMNNLLKKMQTSKSCSSVLSLLMYRYLNLDP